MALSFGFFSDSALTTPVLARLPFVQAVSTPTAVDRVIYFGSLRADRVCKNESNPGVDPVQVTIADAAPASGSTATDVYLALTSGGLNTATGGAALNLPATIAGGVDEAIAIFIRVLDSTHASAVNVDLSLVAASLGEYEA
jgi:hypothetical protein